MKKNYFVVSADRQIKRKIFIEDVLYLKADGSYTEIYFVDKQKITLSRLIKTFMFLTKDYKFYRLGRSNIINLNYCYRLIKASKPYVIMADGKKIFINKQTYNELLKMEFS